MPSLDRQLAGLALSSLALSLGLSIWGGDYLRPGVPATATPPGPKTESLTPDKFRRRPEQTYLTFPEWFLVFSPREYAAYVKHHSPTEFPFLGHLAQFWQGYAAANQQARQYPFNFDYHLMNCIIGASTTAEFLVKASYEATVGRVSELLSGGLRTEEDDFSTRMSEDYCHLLDTKAWYDYPYLDELCTLWTQVPAWGPGMVRKWERRYFLTTEYAFKGAYAHLMLQAARASYTPEIPTTAVLDSQGELHSLPRYQAFQTAATELARNGIQFREIAGNQDSLMISYLMPTQQAAPPSGTRLMFTLPVLTQPERTRVVVKAPISRLHEILQQTEPEHVFDY